MTEEERAAQYRAQCAARLQARKTQLARLAGSQTARDELVANWQPLTDWIHERRIAYAPPATCPRTPLHG
jgi:hypothetical protein